MRFASLKSPPPPHEGTNHLVYGPQKSSMTRHKFSSSLGPLLVGPPSKPDDCAFAFVSKSRAPYSASARRTTFDHNRASRPMYPFITMNHDHPSEGNWEATLAGPGHFATNSKAQTYEPNMARSILRAQEGIVTRSEKCCSPSSKGKGSE